MTRSLGPRGPPPSAGWSSRSCRVSSHNENVAIATANLSPLPKRLKSHPMGEGEVVPALEEYPARRSFTLCVVPRKIIDGTGNVPEFWPMRSEANRQKIEAFMAALGKRVRGEGSIYLTGGATAVLHGWRPMTIDVDIKPEPEPHGLFEAIATIKDELDVNVELASPDDFIPALPGWRERSLFIARYGTVQFFHYDPYSQALSKLQRGHDRDLNDARSMLKDGLVRIGRLREFFAQIEPHLIRYPAIDPASFRVVVQKFCDENE